jgi:hypothetical protein
MTTLQYVPFGKRRQHIQGNGGITAIMSVKHTKLIIPEKTCQTFLRSQCGCRSFLLRKFGSGLFSS